MEGVWAYDCGQFHPTCPSVKAISNGGFLFLHCETCRVLANLEAVSPKFREFGLAMKAKPVTEAPT